MFWNIHSSQDQPLPLRKACAMDLIRGSCPMVTSENLATGSNMSESRSTAGNNIKKGALYRTRTRPTLPLTELTSSGRCSLTSFPTISVAQLLPTISSCFVSQENLVQAIHTAPELHFLASHARPTDHSKTMLHSCSVSSCSVDLGAPALHWSGAAHTVSWNTHDISTISQSMSVRKNLLEPGLAQCRESMSGIYSWDICTFQDVLKNNILSWEVTKFC